MQKLWIMWSEMKKWHLGCAKLICRIVYVYKEVGVNISQWNNTSKISALVANDVAVDHWCCCWSMCAVQLWTQKPTRWCAIEHAVNLDGQQFSGATPCYIKKKEIKTITKTSFDHIKWLLMQIISISRRCHLFNL